MLMVITIIDEIIIIEVLLDSYKAPPPFRENSPGTGYPSGTCGEVECAEAAIANR